jgi:hypothetical protein
MSRKFITCSSEIARVLSRSLEGAQQFSISALQDWFDWMVFAVIFVVSWHQGLPQPHAEATV